MKATLIIFSIILLTLSVVCLVHGQSVDMESAVIHHTASPDWSVERIRKIHVDENGWDDIGYHFVIRANGDIEPGRSLMRAGAHAKGRNHMIGIALTGYSEFTGQQVIALKDLIKNMGIKHIQRHHSACPGPGLNVEGLLNRGAK